MAGPFSKRSPGDPGVFYAEEINAWIDSSRSNRSGRLLTGMSSLEPGVDYGYCTETILPMSVVIAPVGEERIIGEWGAATLWVPEIRMPTDNEVWGQYTAYMALEGGYEGGLVKLSRGKFWLPCINDSGAGDELKFVLPIAIPEEETDTTSPDYVGWPFSQMKVASYGYPYTHTEGAVGDFTRILNFVDLGNPQNGIRKGTVSEEVSATEFKVEVSALNFTHEIEGVHFDDMGTGDSLSVGSEVTIFWDEVDKRWTVLTWPCPEDQAPLDPLNIDGGSPT